MTGNQQHSVESDGESPATITNPETPMTTETTTDITRPGTSQSNETEDDEKHPSTGSTPEQKTIDTIDALPSVCEDCGNEDLSRSDKRAEISCDECGSVVDIKEFPQTAGWKRHALATNERQTSVTDNNDSGISMSPLGGTIDWKDMDGYGSSLSSKKRARMHRLRNHDQSLDTGNAKTSNYKYALGEINRMAAGIDAPRATRDAATEMYEEILEEEYLTGRSIEAAATAVLYAACNETIVSRDLSELAGYSYADESEIADTYERLSRDLGLNDHGDEITTHVGPLCNALDLDTDIRSVAEDLLTDTVTEELLDDGSLIEHTAAAIYAGAVRCGEVISQERLASTAGISTDAVRRRYQQHVEATAFNTAY